MSRSWPLGGFPFFPYLLVMDNEPSQYPVRAARLLLASGHLPRPEHEKLMKANGYEATCRALDEVVATFDLHVLQKFDEAERKLISLGVLDAIRHLHGRT